MSPSEARASAARGEADAVAARVHATAIERAATREHIERGDLLHADTPERIAKRRSRLAAGPLHAVLAAERDDGAGDAALERYINGNDTQPAWFLTRGAEIRRTVGRIHIREGARRIGWGTGFLVYPGLLLSNCHVLPTLEMALTSRVQFDYEEDWNGDTSSGATFDLDPHTLYVADPPKTGCDIALVAVSQRARAETVSTPPASSPGISLADFPFNTLVATEGKVTKGSPVNIVHHPEGQTRSISIRENRLTAITDPALAQDWLHYETDTASGSSGAPLFNDEWEVVGIHHSGVEKRDSSGHILATNGEVWQPSQGDNAKWWEANEGLRVSALIRLLEAALGRSPADASRPPAVSEFTDVGRSYLESLLDAAG